MIFTRFVVLLLVFVLFCFRDIPMHHRKRLAGTHVTGQDCWALVSRRPQSIVYIHLHHRAHVYSSSHSPVCVRNNIGGSGGGGGGFFLRTILLTRSRIFWTKPKMFDIFWWGMNFLIRAVIYQLLLSGWGGKNVGRHFPEGGGRIKKLF